MCELLKDKRLASILDQLADGVWDSQGGTIDELFRITQCKFCYVGPHSEHDDNCPVKLAREIQNEYS